jgi:hypothetical protein
MSNPSDLQWARRTGGRLSSTDRMALMLDVLKLQTRRWWGCRTEVAMSEFVNVVAAQDECRDVCHPAVYAHCLRTFAWASFIGTGQGLAFDREALAVAALLHDIEVGRTAERAATGCACFACAGGLRAEAFSKAHGKNAAWARIVGDAISMHLDPVVPMSLGAVAHLLQAGAAVDVIGVGLSQIAPHPKDAVLSSYPRDGFKQALVACMEQEAILGQRTRMALFMSRGFGQRILDAPLP